MSSSSNIADVPIAPMSLKTSALLRLSSPLAVNLAYSSSATELLSILTVLVFEIPNVSDA